MDSPVDSPKELLKSFDTRIRELETRARKLKGEKLNLMDALVSVALNSAPSCNRSCCGSMPRKFVFGSWDCEKSPTGQCVYNHNMDPAHDDCLFCHDPEERK